MVSIYEYLILMIRSQLQFSISILNFNVKFAISMRRSLTSRWDHVICWSQYPVVVFVVTDSAHNKNLRLPRLQDPISHRYPPATMDFNLKPFLLIFIFLSVVDGSVHVYGREAFKEVGNAYILSGGSEGVVSSHSRSSFIR